MEAAPPPSKLPYTIHDVNHCSFDQWYPKFKNLTIKSIVLDIPSEFLKFILQDSVHLSNHEESKTRSSSEEDFSNKNYASDQEIENIIRYVKDSKLNDDNDNDDNDNDNVNDDNDNDDNDNDNVNDDNDNTNMLVQGFSSLLEDIKNGMKELGGTVFIKTNWSAPKDAVWMLGSLKCRVVDDILLLLQSSDFIVHDLCEPYLGCHDFDESLTSPKPSKVVLVLRKWCNLNDSMQFRCFVKGNIILAACQRICTEFYDHLHKQKEEIMNNIEDFFDANLRHKFPNENFVFDVYIDKRNKVYLIDFNVFGSVTDPLLYTWEEILALDTDELDFRLVTSDTKLSTNPLSSYRAPTDLLDHLVPSGGLDEFIKSTQNEDLFQQSQKHITSFDD